MKKHISRKKNSKRFTSKTRRNKLNRHNTSRTRTRTKNKKNYKMQGGMIDKAHADNFLTHAKTIPETKLAAEIGSKIINETLKTNYANRLLNSHKEDAKLYNRLLGYINSNVHTSFYNTATNTNYENTPVYSLANAKEVQNPQTDTELQSAKNQPLPKIPKNENKYHVYESINNAYKNKNHANKNHVYENNAYENKNHANKNINYNPLY